MKIIRLVSLVMIVFLFSFLPATPRIAQAQDYIYQQDFENGKAIDWQLNPGWQIIQDQDNFVLSGEGHSWATNEMSYDDYRLKFRIKIIKGTVHLNVRMSNSARYFIGFDAQGTRISKQYFPDTFFENLAVSNQTHPLEEWLQVEVNVDGGLVSVSVNGKTEVSYTDPDPILIGGFAFETLDDSKVLIDDIKVELAADSAYIVDDSISNLTWVYTGGPLGGLGYDIRMQPENPEKMFVTDSWAGVFTSTDGGANWTMTNTGISTRTGGTGDAIPIFCLTIDPVHSNIIWAGTQNTRGIFKSTDGGITWASKVQGVIEEEGITFRGFSVDPTNSDIVFAAAELSSYVWNHGQPVSGREFDMTKGVVYKTTDGGENWDAVWRGDNLARYIWIDPRDTNVLYLSTGIFDREAGNSDPVTGDPGGEGVLKSVDGGITWTHINNGLKNLYVGSLFMHPSNPDILIAGTGNNQYYENAGVYLSVDAGATWTQTLATEGGETIESVEFSTSNPAIAYAGSTGSVYRSEDGGLTWRHVSSGQDNGGWGSPGVRAGFPIDFQVDPINPDRIFANNYGGGNFLSEDGGRTWVDASRGYTGAQVRGIAVVQDEPGYVIAAARSGIFASKDGGSNWSGLSNAPVNVTEWNVIAIDPNDPHHFVAETNCNSWLINSYDGGKTWEHALDLSGQRVGWSVIVFAPSDPDVLYAGSTGFFSAGSFDTTQPGKGIYISMDHGKNWALANNSLTQDSSVYSLAVDPLNSQVVFAATANHGLVKTTNGGQEWDEVTAGLPEVGATTVIYNPAKNNILLAGFERHALYRSIDGGQTWEISMRGMSPEAQITSIVFDPTSSGEIVYAADSFSGVYRSADGGQKWALINNGLLMRSVNALAISADGLHLYAATEGGGVFRLDMNGIPPEGTPSEEQVLNPATVMPEGNTLLATSTPVAQKTTKTPFIILIGGLFLVLLLAGLGMGIKTKKKNHKLNDKDLPK